MWTWQKAKLAKAMCWKAEQALMQNRMWPNNCFYLDQPVFLIIIESQNCVEIDELHSPSRNVREQQMGKWESCKEMEKGIHFAL